jgi:serine/threonine-protein phosphatase 6 regulatory ankyrin repeat subunit B
VQRLLSNGADINARDKEGTTALLRATIKGHTEIVKLLLENKNLDTKQKLTAMMWAERQGHTEIARLLRQAGVSIDDAPLNDQLLYAAVEGNIRQVQLLLNKGAEVNTKDTNDGSTALMLAAEKGHSQIVRLLLDRGADINEQSNFGGTALLWTLLRGHTDLAHFMLENGLRTNHNFGHWTVYRAQGYTM